MVQETAPPHLLQRESSRQSALMEYRARRLEKQSEKGWRQQLVLQGEQNFAKPLNTTQSIPDPLCESFSTNGYSAGESGWALSASLLTGRMKRLLCQAVPLSLTNQGTLLSTVHKHWHFVFNTHARQTQWTREDCWASQLFISTWDGPSRLTALSGSWSPEILQMARGIFPQSSGIQERSADRNSPLGRFLALFSRTLAVLHLDTLRGECSQLRFSPHLYFEKGRPSAQLVLFDASPSMKSLFSVPSDAPPAVLTTGLSGLWGLSLW